MSNIYDEAITIQDACNPNGVARFLVKVLDHMREKEDVTDTAAQCKHPLFVLVVNKLDSLVRDCDARIGSDLAFSNAYEACKWRAEEHPDGGDHAYLKSKALPGHPQPRYCWELRDHEGDCKFDHGVVGLAWHCNKTR